MHNSVQPFKCVKKLTCEGSDKKVTLTMCCGTTRCSDKMSLHLNEQVRRPHCIKVSLELRVRLNTEQFLVNVLLSNLSVRRVRHNVISL